MIGKKFSASQEMNVIGTKIHAKQKQKNLRRRNRRGPATGAAPQQANMIRKKIHVQQGRQWMECVRVLDTLQITLSLSVFIDN